MVRITPLNETFVFEIIGMHKIWAMENKITVAKKNVIDVQITEKIPFWKGFRAPGTEVPGLIAAGTFYLKGRNFWDVVMYKTKTITVELENEYYKKLIIDVKDPQAAVELLNQK